jgi:acetolactate synthase I/II/III large subunit
MQDVITVYSWSMAEEEPSFTVAEWLARAIASAGITKAYTLSGGMIVFILDAIKRFGFTEIVSVRHEQAAGFSAEGHARITKNLGLALATSGPGATNLITAVASAYFDSVPVIFVTGQVNTNELKLNEKQRQNGFQELDIVDSIRKLTKFSYQISKPNEIHSVWAEAILTAKEGRPGPVHIDIPIDIQQAHTPSVGNSWQRKGIHNKKIHRKRTGIFKEQKKQSTTRRIIEEVSTATRPLLLVGGGVRISDSVTEVRELVRQTGIPTVSTLMGIDVLPNSCPENIGFIGSYGNRLANSILKKSDLLLVFGSRLDVRQTGSNVTNFLLGKRVLRVDFDPFELKGRIRSDIQLLEDLKTFTHEFLKVATELKIEKWKSEIATLRQELGPRFLEQPELDFNPNQAVAIISELASSVDGYFVDVGQHQMWAAQSLKIMKSQRFITSGGMGAMGFALPAAVGGVISMENKAKYAVITGDGCFQLSLPELQTVAERNLNLKIFLFNNNQHGMVAQFQERNTSGRFVGTREGYETPNFMKISNAFNIPYAKVSSEERLKHSIFELVERSGPCLIELDISREARALPRLEDDQE